EASLRRIAHFDYWSEKVRRSILLDSKADLLVYGNAERAIVEIAHRIAAGESPDTIRDVRGTVFALSQLPDGYRVIDSSHIDTPGPVKAHSNPYEMETEKAPCTTGETTAKTTTKPSHDAVQAVAVLDRPADARLPAVIRLPSYEQVCADPVLYAHASRVLHLETNPGNARPLVQAHGNREVWVNPPPIPLSTEELDSVFELPYTRQPHPAYGDAVIPAYEMIRFSVNIMRGCFGGCTFCSITEHEGRIIQSRSEDSILQEIEAIR